MLKLSLSRLRILCTVRPQSTSEVQVSYCFLPVDLAHQPTGPTSRSSRVDTHVVSPRSPVRRKKAGKRKGVKNLNPTQNQKFSRRRPTMEGGAGHAPVTFQAFQADVSGVSRLARRWLKSRLCTPPLALALTVAGACRRLWRDIPSTEP